MSTLPHTPGFGWTTRRIRRARKQRKPSTSPRVVDELPRLRAEKEFADTQAARDRRLHVHCHRVVGSAMTRTIWSPEQDAELVRRYPHEHTADIARDVGHPVRSCYNRAHHFGLKKTPEYLASPDAHRCDGRKGMNTRFQPGQASWNKGKSYQAGGRSVETHFQKGQKPHTWRPVGTERVTEDGYLQRKVSDTGNTVHDYVEVHRLVWQEHHGPIPPGHVVVFRDRNRTNCAIENLELISRAELARRNSIHRLPPELKEMSRLLGSITREINKQEKAND